MKFGKFFAYGLGVAAIAGCAKLSWTSVYATGDYNIGRGYVTHIGSDGATWWGGYEEQRKENGGRTGTNLFLEKKTTSGALIFRRSEPCEVVAQANACWVSGITTTGSDAYIATVQNYGSSYNVASIEKIRADTGATQWRVTLPRDVLTGNSVEITRKGSALVVSYQYEGEIAYVDENTGTILSINGPGYPHGDRTLFPDATSGLWELSHHLGSRTAFVVSDVYSALYGVLDRTENAGVQHVVGVGRIGADIFTFGFENVSENRRLLARRVVPTGNGLEVRDTTIVINDSGADYVATAEASGGLCYASVISGSGKIQIGGIAKDTLAHWSKTINVMTVNGITYKENLKFIDLKAAGPDCAFAYQDKQETYHEQTTVVVRNAADGTLRQTGVAKDIIAEAIAVSDKAIAVVGYASIGNTLPGAHITTGSKPLLVRLKR